MRVCDRPCVRPGESGLEDSGDRGFVRGHQPQNYSNVFYNKFTELAQQYSDNAFDFQLFPSMQLGDEQETVRGLQLGTIHISNVATNNYTPSPRPAAG